MASRSRRKPHVWRRAAAATAFMLLQLSSAGAGGGVAASTRPSLQNTAEVHLELEGRSVSLRNRTPVGRDFLQAEMLPESFCVRLFTVSVCCVTTSSSLHPCILCGVSCAPVTADAGLVRGHEAGVESQSHEAVRDQLC